MCLCMFVCMCEFMDWYVHLCVGMGVCLSTLEEFSLSQNEHQILAQT